MASFLEKARLRQFRYVHLGTPCSTWINLYRKPSSPNTRTLENLWGLGRSRAEIAGNKTMRFSLAMIHEQIVSGGWVSLETPLGSWIVELPQIKAWIKEGTLFQVHFSACSYLPPGMRYKKPTIIVTNAPWAKGLASQCTCATHDVDLMEKHGGKRLALYAAEYPPLLCARWPELLAAAVRQHTQNKAG